MDHANLLDLQAERLEAFQELIGYRFSKPELLLEALIHSSHVNEAPEQGMPDNERLEFLGDAVLEFIVTEYLYAKYPGEKEGRLTVMRSAIVDRRRCAELAQAIGMNGFVLLGRGEQLDKQPMRKSILANAYEALIGAVYLDGGIDAARMFTIRMVERHCPGIELETTGNYKAELQIYSQRSFQRIPHYSLLRAYGPDHQKTFDVAVSIGGVVHGSGSGSSKKAAQQRAAHVALVRLQQSTADETAAPEPPKRSSYELIGEAVLALGGHASIREVEHYLDESVYAAPSDVGGTMADMCVDAPKSSTVPEQWRVLERVRRGVYRHVHADAV
ncbi:MAG: ribonuclease III [Verrucomicrobia bacterium]|nr:ribonuclease III [Verrucomicrobiota bacterium]